MIAEVLNWQNYQSSWFAVPTFLTASVLLAMGVMVRDRRATLARQHLILLDDRDGSDLVI